MKMSVLLYSLNDVNALVLPYLSLYESRINHDCEGGMEINCLMDHCLASGRVPSNDLS